MVETRHQSASNEENLRSLELLEGGEVSPTPTIQQTDGTIAEALKLLDSSASTLGFTAEDISAFLLDALHTLHNCDTLPSKDIHIKAFTSSKPTKSKAPNHNFARGSCKFGDTCKYAHGDLTSPKKNPSKTPFLATAIVPSHMPQPLGYPIIWSRSWDGFDVVNVDSERARSTCSVVRL